MHLATLPKSFRGDQIPVIAIDSPFPPLKPDRRYRGVYERAGFDVNLGNASFSDNRSLNLGRTAKSLGGSGRTGIFAQNNDHRHHDPKTRGFSSASACSSPSQTFRLGPEKRLPAKHNNIQPSYASHLKANDHNPLHLSSLASSASSSLFLPSFHGSVASSYASADRLQIKQFRPEQKNPRLQYSSTPNEQWKNETGDRTKKQLKLNILDEQPSYLTTADASAVTSEYDLPFDETYRSPNYTPSTSASSSEHFASKTRKFSIDSEKTSDHPQNAPYPLYNNQGNTIGGSESNLANTRKDKQKPFDPRGNSFNKKSTSGFVPATGDSSESFHKKSMHESIGALQDASSTRQLCKTGEIPGGEFDHFLNTSAQGKKPTARDSLFSTVSSIISKQRESEIVHTGEGNNGSYEEDDEVALELQRQLDQIKAGNETSLVLNGMINYDNSFFTAANSCGREAGAVPTFKISNESAPDRQFEESGSKVELNSNDMNDTMMGDYTTEPLQFSKRDATHASEPLTPHFKQSHFDNDRACETPETIKPLSPKNHSVKKELEHINFDFLHQGKPKDLLRVTRGQSDIDIHGEYPTPLEFDAFPRSVIDPNFPDISQKAAPGTGPCRGCGMSLKTEARGSKKPVYSKQGDLSGQWHRGCFKCSYAECPIQFNKEVTPYVLLDIAFCNHHYHSLNNTLCETCHVGIEGECIENELKQKWHLSCLKCTRCLGVIRSDYFLVNHQIVCEADASEVIKGLKNTRSTTLDKVEKRRTRMLIID